MSESRTVFDEFFPHRVCINLDRRPERWEKMQTRLEAAGLGAVDRFPAVDGGSGMPSGGRCMTPSFFSTGGDGIRWTKTICSCSPVPIGTFATRWHWVETG